MFPFFRTLATIYDVNHKYNISSTDDILKLPDTLKKKLFLLHFNIISTNMWNFIKHFYENILFVTMKSNYIHKYLKTILTDEYTINPE